MSAETSPQSGLEWLAAAEELEPVGSITHCKILRNNGISSVSLPSGDIDASTEPATGVYHRDTRHLSRFSITLGGLQPRLLDAKLLPNALTAVSTNPPLALPDGTVLVGQKLVLRRQRVIDGTVLELLSVSNYSGHEVNLAVRVGLDADFRDILEVRGFHRHSPDPEVIAEVRPDRFRFRAVGGDGIERGVRIEFSRPADQTARNEAVFFVRLAPQATERIQFEICLSGEPSGRVIEAAAVRVEQGQHDWLQSITSIETDNEVVNGAIKRALIDIYSLRTINDGHPYTAAGVPWFDTLFGRDSLIAGIELAAVAPDVLRTALATLATYQADEHNDERDAEPGKIPHELRWGELAGTGEVPFGAYYGSVDATPLFLVAAGEYLRWTDDHAFLERLRPALDRAVAWCQLAERRGGGLLSYARQSTGGLEHQGWKDSRDGVVWPDGSPVAPPVSLIEAQGYLAAAFAAYAFIVERTEPEVARTMRDAARSVVLLIERTMSHEQLGYVLCLDGERRPVPTPSSNSGHLLWLGAACTRQAAQVADTMLRPELFSGWGIRTLSTSVATYNPLGYHTGSVWPHDNAIILAGLRRYGLDAAAEQLGSAFVRLITRFDDFQVPELFSGDAKDLRVVPTPYPVSSRPQAWSAAAVPYVLISMLGIRPTAGGKIAVTGALMPADLRWIRLGNIRCGAGSADLLFRRRGDHVAVEIEHVRGDLEIVLTRSVPDALLAAGS